MAFDRKIAFQESSRRIPSPRLRMWRTERLGHRFPTKQVRHANQQMHV